MIPRAAIIEWRNHAPWGSDSQVEQDLILSRAIVDIFSDDNVRGKVAFRGGTALHKLFLPKPLRYSEDIDLVQLKSAPIGDLLDSIRLKLSWLGKPKTANKEESTVLFYKFTSEVEPIQQMRVKIEINTREHFNIFGMEENFFEVQSQWFRGKSNIPIYTIEELLGTKMRALYQRKKGRDLFDLSAILNQIPSLKNERIVSCFQEYMKREGVKVTRANFEENMTKKIVNKVFLGDLPPLLPTDVADFDMVKAWEHIHSTLIQRLPGAPWKGRAKSSHD